MTSSELQGICKDCDTYRERIFTNIQRRCTWTCTEVDPNEKCPCRPSHFVPARDTTVRIFNSSAENEELMLKQIEKIISDRIQELKYPASGNCVREALLGENQALWAQIQEFRG